MRDPHQQLLIVTGPPSESPQTSLSRVVSGFGEGRGQRTPTTSAVMSDESFRSPCRRSGCVDCGLEETMVGERFPRTVGATLPRGGGRDAAGRIRVDLIAPDSVLGDMTADFLVRHGFAGSFRHPGHRSVQRAGGVRRLAARLRSAHHSRSWQWLHDALWPLRHAHQAGRRLGGIRRDHRQRRSEWRAEHPRRVLRGAAQG